MRASDPGPVSAREWMLGFFVLLALATTVFHPFVFGDRTLENGAATVDSLYPSGSQKPNTAPQRYLRERDPFAGGLFSEPILALDHNEIANDRALPLWNPYSGFGMPLAADMQSQPFSPFAAVPILHSSARAYDIFVALRLLAGAFLMFLYARRFTTVLPALAGAAAYFFGGYFWLYISLPQESAEVLTPGLLLGVELVLARPGPKSAAILAGLCGVSLLGGMPEASALALLFVGIYALARLRVAGKTTRTASAYLAAAAVFGVALAAIVVLPFLSYAEASSNSHRSGDAASLIDSNRSDPLSVEALCVYFAPLVVGSPGPDVLTPVRASPVRGFFGISTFFLAELAVFGAIADLIRRRPRENTPVFFFTATAVVMVARRFGFPIASTLDHLPVLRLILLSKYEEAIVACCVAALAAFGAQRICARTVGGGQAILAFLLPFAVLLAEAATPATMPQTEGGLHAFALIGACVFLVLAAAVALGAMRAPSIRASTLGIACVALAALEVPLLFVIPLYDVLNPQPPNTMSPLRGAPYISYLQAHLTNGERFLGEDTLLTPNWSDAFSIMDVRALDALYPVRYLRFVRAFLPMRDTTELLYYFVGRFRYDLRQPLVERFLALSSVRYVGFAVRKRPLTPGDAAGLKPAFTDVGARLYENPSPLPRVAVYRHVIAVPDGAAALARITRPDFDPAREAIVEGSVPDELRTTRATAVTAGRFERYEPSDVVVVATATAPSLLVLNDTDFDGWDATIDGIASPILQANYLFRGVVIGPGTHRIEFHYMPRSFEIGAIVSLAALACIVAACAAKRRTRPTGA